MAMSWRDKRDFVPDRYVTVQYRTDGESATNFPVDDWDETRTRNIAMQRQERSQFDFSGSESRNALQVHASVETRWLMRYRTDMDPDLVDVARNRRLVYQGRVLDILSAEHIGRKDKIELVTVANPSGETA